jgi:hypothetical protein
MQEEEVSSIILESSRIKTILATAPKAVVLPNHEHNSNEEQLSSSFPVTALLISSSVVGSILLLTLPFIVLPFLSGQTMPYMATPKKKIIDALEFVQQHQHTRTRKLNHPLYNTSLQNEKPRHFLDLGSGDGEAVYQAVQLRNKCAQNDNEPNSCVNKNKHYFNQCTGVELNTTLYLWSCWRRTMFMTRHEKLRSKFLCRNMFQPQRFSKNLIRQADVIMIFGIPPLMAPLSELLLQQQCQPGTYILSYRFPLPITDDVQNETISLLPAKIIYDQDEMRIYECISVSIASEMHQQTTQQVDFGT